MIGIIVAVAFLAFVAWLLRGLDRALEDRNRRILEHLDRRYKRTDQD